MPYPVLLPLSPALIKGRTEELIVCPEYPRQGERGPIIEWK